MAGILRKTSKPETQKRDSELAEIFIEAALLSLELWAQKSELRIIGAENLCGQSFDICSDVYEPHGSMQLDTEDKSMDGEQIQIVMTPGIQALGNAAGEHMEDGKMWSPAIVLIFPHLQENSGSPDESQQLVNDSAKQISVTLSSTSDRETTSKRLKTNSGYIWAGVTVEAATDARENTNRHHRNRKKPLGTDGKCAEIPEGGSYRPENVTSDSCSLPLKESAVVPLSTYGYDKAPQPSLEEEAVSNLQTAGNQKRQACQSDASDSAKPSDTALNPVNACDALLVSRNSEQQGEVFQSSPATTDTQLQGLDNSVTTFGVFDAIKVIAMACSWWNYINELAENS